MPLAPAYACGAPAGSHPAHMVDMVEAAILVLCGITPALISPYCRVDRVPPTVRQDWLKETERLGRNAA